MARKTIMKKEPTVSVALPNSEKERLGMPTSPPVRQQLQRLSPGVYRNQMGQLTTSTGRALPRRNPQQQPGNRITDAMNQQPQQRPEIATRPPAPLGTPPEMRQRDPGYFQPIDLHFGGMVNQPSAMPQMGPEQYQPFTELVKQQGTPSYTPTSNMPPMPEPSANRGGQYRLSPGVYGTREQALDQYYRQFAQSMPQEIDMQQGAPNSGPGSFPMQQRERELGYAENRFNNARNNNLFRGNPMRRFGF